MPFGQSGGSIVGISPGIAIAQGGSGGGSIVGITPGRFFTNTRLVKHFIGHKGVYAYFIFSGAALEKKSVRELAAGLNRLGKMKLRLMF